MLFFKKVKMVLRFAVYSHILEIVANTLILAYI